MDHHSKVAVFIRCHEFSLKAAHLFSELEGGLGYDLFFMTDETNGVHDYGGRKKVPFTANDLRSFGVDPSYHLANIHYGDLMPSIFERLVPGYAFYIMLDYDIYFSHLGRAWMEILCHSLCATEPSIDMVAPQLGPAPAAWVWHAAAATRFSEVFGSFFPIVALSQRAIQHNESMRKKEASIIKPGETPVFCESFLPSALHEGGYNLVDLNVLLPGSYALQSFNFALPAPFRPARDCKIGRVIHPIKAMIDAPLASDAASRVREVEPHRGHPIAADLAFAVAADLVRSQAAYRGLQDYFSALDASPA